MVAEIEPTPGAARDSELRILMLEDAPADAELNAMALREAGIGFVSQRVQTRAAFIRALDEFQPHVILSDVRLPAFDGHEALGIARERRPETPVIIVTGAVGDELAVELLKSGARDYVLKDRLARLPSAVQRVLAEEQDAAARRQVIEALRRSEQHLREVYENSPLAYQALDADARLIDINPAWCAMMGFTHAEVLNRGFAELVATQYAARVHQRLTRFEPPGEIHGMEFELVRKDGTHFEVELDCRVALDERGAFKQAHCILRDITERKRGELSIRRTNHALKTLSSGNEALVRATGEAELLESMCRVLVNEGGYRAVWIGYVDSDATRLRPRAWAGQQEGWFSFERQLASLTPDEPVLQALRTGLPQMTRDLATSPAFAHCREDALRAGFKASVTLPLKSERAVIGALTIYSSELDGLDDAAVALLVELASDLSYGVHALRTRAEKERGVIREQATMEATIQALANTVELRDPYTAGHQQRVARFATAIARRLDLPAERVRGLRLAAMVHDVGKIHIPAEILSRPGKLSSIEYQLVQTHVEAGYEILRSIDFPWPIAEIVRQHHEHLDGSGYPHGLRGDEIVPDARILIVADVLEAMSAHRPYRPGLGAEVALEAIRRGAGVLYDAEVCRACGELFSEGQFRFDSATVERETGPQLPPTLE